MIFWMLKTMSDGPISNEVPVSIMASQPPSQAITTPFMEMLRDREIKQVPGSHWGLPSLPPPPWLSPEQPFNSCLPAVSLSSDHTDLL